MPQSYCAVLTLTKSAKMYENTRRKRQAVYNFDEMRIDIAFTLC